MTSKSPKLTKYESKGFSRFLSIFSWSEVENSSWIEVVSPSSVLKMWSTKKELTTQWILLTLISFFAPLVLILSKVVF